MQFCVFSPAFADPPLVSSVRVEGARLLSVRDLRSSLETRPGKALDSLALRRDVDRILDRCRTAGLYLAEVEFPGIILKGRRASVVFRLREGPPVRVRRLDLGEADSIDLLAGMETRPGRIFRPGALEADVEAILRRCENAGYPFCAVYPTVGMPSSDGVVDVSLRIEKGALVRIGDLRISGNGATRPSVVQRLMGLRTGERYDQRRVDRGREALRRSGLFDAVSDVTLSHDARSGTVDLSVQVAERKANRIDGAVGYVPGGEGGRGYVAGLLDLALRNLAGTGRSASIRWDRKGPSASDLSLGYDEPWIGSASLSGHLRFALLQRPGYVSSVVRVGLGLPLAGPFTAEMGAGWEQVSPDSSGLGLAPRSRTWTGEGGFSAEARNDPDNPRSGGFIRASVSLGRASLTARGATVNRWRFEADAERLIPLFRMQTVAVAAHVQGVHTGGSTLPLSEKVRLGGASSLRGYREEQFAGIRAVWGGVEYRLLIGRRSRVFLFLDTGAIVDQRASGAKVRQTALYRTGYGAGLRAESHAGVVGLDFGLGQDDGLSQGKVHVRMMHRF